MSTFFLHTGEVDGIRRVHGISLNDLGVGPLRVKEPGTSSEIFLSSSYLNSYWLPGKNV